MNSHVYLMRIGFSTNLPKRLAQMMTKAGEAEFVLAYPGTRDDEKMPSRRSHE